jgi:hypothetical protein
MNLPVTGDGTRDPEVDAIYRDKLRWARAIPEDRKFFLGLAMFEDVCARMRSGIQSQYPSATEIEVDAMLTQRFARLRQVHEHGVYFPLEAKPE